MLQHVRNLLEDRRFALSTVFGPRPASSLGKDLRPWDRAKELKSLLLDLDKPDFNLQDRLPTGIGFDANLTRQVLLAFRQTIGHVRFASLPPTRALALGEAPQPLTARDVRDRVAALPPARNDGQPVGPMTLILLSTGGFTEDARDTARSFIDGPPTILIEPNDAGGFTLVGPAGAEAMLTLLDPEHEADQRSRARAAIREKRVELLTGGVALDVVARQTKLPLSLVEHEARHVAETSGDGLRVKRVEGVPMLYRDASVARPAAGSGRSAASGIGSFDSGLPASSAPPAPTAMPRSNPVLDRLRTLFGGSTESERKIAYLAERRAALSRQRDLAYEELGVLEERENELRDAFKDTEHVTSRRRLTSQIVQLQKDVERRRQTVGVLNQQINVVGTHLHNLEIARQGSTAALPSGEEIAQDAAKAEEVLAELQASNELADELMGGMATVGLSDEEAALYEQLAAEAAGDGQEPASITNGNRAQLPGERLMNAQRARNTHADPVAPEPETELPEEPAPEPAAKTPQRTDPEPG